MIYQFKIKIAGITKPPVWRKIEVPSNFTFMQFNHIIQIAFGWENAHLWNFTDRKDMFGRGSFRIAELSEFDADYDEDTLDANKVLLSEIFSKNQSLTYVYDFGDYWIHEITLEGTLLQDRPVAFCTGGKGATPPEDCGGVGGYEGMKCAFEENNSEVASYREWLGMKRTDNWNPAEFSRNELRAINSAFFQMRDNE